MKEFNPFQLVTDYPRNWPSGREEHILLEPNAYAILQLLVDHAGRLLTHDRFLNTAWPDTHVRPEVLNHHVVDIQNLLGDHTRNPMSIEGPSRRGCQFSAAVHDVMPAGPGQVDTSAETQIVERDRSRRGRRQCRGRAWGEQRQILFVRGEPAIGESTLVKEFDRQPQSPVSRTELRLSIGRRSEELHAQPLSDVATKSTNHFEQWVFDFEQPAPADKAASVGTRRSLLGRQFGPYRILSLLGAGGMGEVYRAHDNKLGRDVAIKTLRAKFAQDPSRLARFLLEARTLASLNHPNIGAVYGLEEFGGANCLVLELVEGDTWHGPLPLSVALDRACQLAEALEASHDHGIIHRDLKPANVKVTPQGRVKLLDFGLAKAVWETKANRFRSQAATLIGVETLTGQIVGTPGYMSPEQVQGGKVDQRTDIWAFGCLFYELLTGRRTFPGGTIMETISSVLGRKPDWKALPTGTPAGICRLLCECLQKEPGRRLANMRDARGTIEAVRRGRARLLKDRGNGR